MTGVKILGACERGVQQMSMWLKSCTGPFQAVSGVLEQVLQEGCSNPPGVGWDRCPQFQTGMPCSFSAADIETCTRSPRRRHLLLSPLPNGSTPRRDSKVRGASAEEVGQTGDMALGSDLFPGLSVDSCLFGSFAHYFPNEFSMFLFPISKLIIYVFWTLIHEDSYGLSVRKFQMLKHFGFLSERRSSS